jgi:hypothetical protein
MDSYTYIIAASRHSLISFRPIGYSRFLELIHIFTTSDTVVVFIQYIIIQTGSLFLFFTLLQFFNPGKLVTRVLFVFLIFNPATLYISNYILSDALFIGLSLYWITLLIWIIVRPQWYEVIAQAILLFLIFELRFASLYYPVVLIAALIICRWSWWLKGAVIALSVLPIIFEMQHIRSATYKETGTAVFSAFSGWQIANNALHMYPFIKVDNSDLPSPACKELDSIVKEYFETMPASALSGREATTEYMWSNESPLKKYLYYKKKPKDIYFNAWNAVSPTLSAYGYSLIKKHPVAFTRYYWWPCAKTYLLPPVESLNTYNEGKDSVDEVARQWFRYKTPRVKAISKNFQHFLLWPYTYLFFVVNIVFCALLIASLIKQRKMAITPRLRDTIVFTGIFWLVHAGFSSFSTPVVYRYQHLALIILLAFSLIIAEQLKSVTIHSQYNRRGSIK